MGSAGSEGATRCSTTVQYNIMLLTAVRRAVRTKATCTQRAVMFRCFVLDPSSINNLSAKLKTCFGTMTTT